MKSNYRHVVAIFGPRYNHFFHKGIASYARKNQWHLSVYVHSGNGPLPQFGKLNGVILAHDFPITTLTPFLEMKVPGVTLLVRPDVTALVQVVGDNLAIGKMAGDHFVDRGTKNFAFFGPKDPTWSQLRREGFSKTVRGAAHSYKDVFINPGQNWELERKTLARKIVDLEKPCGAFCVSDPLACRVLHVCLDLGIKVPEEMAILGVDNDPLYCESVAVPISSIQHDAISIGYQGAQQLDLLMRGEPSPPPKLIAPLGIELRRSTEQFFITNPDVLCALRFISEKYASNMGVDDVAAAVGRSRRTLQILFRKELGESIVDRIVKTRIAKAQELLTRSTKSMADVAKSSGFTSSSYFHRVFKASHGCTPVKYRQLTRGQS